MNSQSIHNLQNKWEGACYSKTKPKERNKIEENEKSKKFRDDCTYLIFSLKNARYDVEDVDAQPQPRLNRVC